MCDHALAGKQTALHDVYMWELNGPVLHSAAACGNCMRDAFRDNVNLAAVH